MQKNLFLLRDGKDHIIQNTFYATLLSNILSSLTTSVGALIDGVVIGQFLGVNATAAFGVISPIMIVFALFGAIVASGARNRFTHLVGSGCVEEAQGGVDAFRRSERVLCHGADGIRPPLFRAGYGCPGGNRQRSRGI